MKNILLTGGAGFIGSTLAESLLNDGYGVTVIDVFSDFYEPQIKERNIAGLLLNPNFKLIRADITDLAALRAQVQGAFDAIVHIAAKAGVRPSIEDPIGYETVNVTGTLNLLELARERNIKQFVFASSSSVYGTNPNVPWGEDDNIDLPISPYAATKRAAELHGHVYSHLHGIRFLALRLFTVYGPKQRPDLAIHKFAKLIFNQQPVTLFGKGDTMRDYTYVDDIVFAFKQAIKYDKSLFEIINIGNSKTVSLLELVEGLEKTFDIKPIIRFENEQPGDVPRTFSNISKAQELLGYTPATSLETGLANFRDWFYTVNKKVHAG